VIKPRFLKVRRFQEGLAAVMDTSTGRWGFINPSGEIAFPAQFQDADAFSEGLARIHLDDSGVAFIDHQGTIIIKSSYVEAAAFHEGLSAVSKNYQTWFLIDKSGTTVKGLTGFDDVQSFSEGLAAVLTNETYHFVDHAGRTVFDHTYKYTLPFSEGLAATMDKEVMKCGFIDHSGTYVIPPKYEDAGSFSDGLAPVLIDSRWGFIDRTGKLVIANTFPRYANDFIGDLAEVDDPVLGASMYIDLMGKVKFFKNPRFQGLPPDNYSSLLAGKIVYPAADERCFLTLESDPEGADVYLVPEYIWCCGGQGQPSPETLPDGALTEYLKSNLNFRLSQGRTPLREIEVQEENVWAIFLRGRQIDKEFVKIHLGGRNAAKGRFNNP
jgi:WG containing repeat